MSLSVSVWGGGYAIVPSKYRIVFLLEMPLTIPPIEGKTRTSKMGPKSKAGEKKSKG